MLEHQLESGVPRKTVHFEKSLDNGAALAVAERARPRFRDVSDRERDHLLPVIAQMAADLCFVTAVQRPGTALFGSGRKDIVAPQDLLGVHGLDASRHNPKQHGVCRGRTWEEPRNYLP